MKTTKSGWRKLFLAGMSVMVLAFGLVFAGCASTPKVDLTGVTTYYVRADGNDKKNAGISEDAPFKTLQKALEMATKTPVKKITVIGTLVGTTSFEMVEGKTPILPVSTGATGEGQLNTAQIKGSFDETSPGEILITGKADAAGSEKAKLTSNDNTVLSVIGYAVRLENIEISEGTGTGVEIALGRLTLAKGARISNRSRGVNAQLSFVIMRDDAEVSNNAGKEYAGLCLRGGSVLVIQDDAIVSGNKAQENGGGVTLSGSSLYLLGNAKIAKNSAGNVGGGIITFTVDGKNGINSQVTMRDNAVITENTANRGGGIFLQDILKMEGNSQITGNEATGEGGGLFGASDYMSVTAYDPQKAILGNKAPEDPDSNLIWN